jgi:hypothetical protein
LSEGKKKKKKKNKKNKKNEQPLQWTSIVSSGCYSSTRRGKINCSSFPLCNFHLQANSKIKRLEEENLNLRQQIFNSQDEIFQLHATIATIEVETKFQATQEIEKMQTQLKFKVLFCIIDYSVLLYSLLIHRKKSLKREIENIKSFSKNCRN